MSIHFALPWVLAFLPVGIAFILWGHRHSFVSLSPMRRQLLLFFRLCLVATITLAITRPILIGHSRFNPTVFLIDVSMSVSDKTLEASRKFVNEAISSRDNHIIEVVTFAGHAKRAKVDSLGVTIERHDVNDTNLGEAIAVARGLVPQGTPHLVLLTDGNETYDETLAAVDRAGRDGLEIDLVRLLGPAPIDARVTALRTQDILRRHEPSRITVVVESTMTGRATITLRENNLLLQELLNVNMQKGSQSFDIDFEPTVAGLVNYSADISFPGDSVPGNDHFAHLALVGGPPRILLAASTPEEGVHLESALSAQEINVESVSPSSLPSTLEPLLAYDEVILAGIAPVDLDQLRQSALSSYVRDTGGGLLFLAGRQGLHRDPNGKTNIVENMLPLEMAAPSEREEPPVALVLLIDRSGSMIGEKLNYAKQAALAAIDKLSSHDQIGVIAFDAKFDWIVPLSPLDDKEKIKAAVGSLGAGGGTKFYPALEESYFTLGSAEAAVRHVILLTDGVSTDPDIFPDLLEKMRAHAITVSTVAIGHEADAKLLTQIAKLGGGRYTLATSANEVPNIFVKETQTIQRDAAQRTNTQVRVATAARELSGINFVNAPPLKGYIRTKAKASTEVLLETSQHDPLLARWRYGLGSVMAFASDATASWGAEWVTKWSEFGKMWTQLVRGLQRARTRHDLTLSLHLDGDQLKVMVDAIDAEGRFLSDLQVRARIIDGAQQAHEPVLRQVGPGRYVAELAVPSGSLIARPFGNLGGRRLDGDWVVLSRPYSRELAHIGDNETVLGDILRLGHGIEIKSPQEAVRATRQRLPRPFPLTLPLGLIAIVLFVLDLITKRARWEMGR